MPPVATLSQHQSQPAQLPMAVIRYRIARRALALTALCATLLFFFLHKASSQSTTSIYSTCPALKGLALTPTQIAFVQSELAKEVATGLDFSSYENRAPRAASAVKLAWMHDRCIALAGEAIGVLPIQTQLRTVDRTLCESGVWSVICGADMRPKSRTALVKVERALQERLHRNASSCGPVEDRFTGFVVLISDRSAKKSAQPYELKAIVTRLLTFLHGQPTFLIAVHIDADRYAHSSTCSMIAID